VTGGNFLDYEIRRDEAARYGLTVGDIQDIIMTAVGGMNITQTVEGLERYPVNLRYGSELRDTPEKLRRILVPTPTGAQVPIAQLADIRIVKGPPVVKSENARNSAYVYVDITGIDVGTYVKAAQKTVQEKIDLPPGYSLVWSGQYEYMVRAQKRLMIVVPMTLLLIFLLLYFNFKDVTESLLVMLSVPFSLTGGFWLMYILGYNMSVAVGVGFIALAGVAAETGVVMLVYLDISYHKFKGKYGEPVQPAPSQPGHRRGRGPAGAAQDDDRDFHHGGPGADHVGPWFRLPGDEAHRRPMIGGMVSATILTLIVVPVLYGIWKGWRLPED
jgi:Cu(I)/Ag(I) efflux system membrane protein CusA/SilA